MFPQLSVQPSTECTRTDTLHSDPIWFFDGTCHKTPSQTNRHPSINRHILHVQTLPPYIRLLGICALTPTEVVGPLPLLLGGACPLLRARARRQCLYQSDVRVASKRHLNWGTDGGGGVEAQGIGLFYVWGLL